MLFTWGQTLDRKSLPVGTWEVSFDYQTVQSVCPICEYYNSLWLSREKDVKTTRWNVLCVWMRGRERGRGEYSCEGGKLVRSMQSHYRTRGTSNHRWLILQCSVLRVHGSTTALQYGSTAVLLAVLHRLCGLIVMRPKGVNQTIRCAWCDTPRQNSLTRGHLITLNYHRHRAILK